MRALVEDEQKLALVVERIGEILVERPGAGYDPRPPAAPAAGMTFSTLRGKLVSPVSELLPAGRAPTARRGVFLRAREGKAGSGGRHRAREQMRGPGNLLIVEQGLSLSRPSGRPVAAGNQVYTLRSGLWAGHSILFAG